MMPETRKSHLHSKCLSFKLADKFTYLGSNISSTENSRRRMLLMGHRSYGSLINLIR